MTFDPNAFDLAHYEALKFSDEMERCGHIVFMDLANGGFNVVYGLKISQCPPGCMCPVQSRVFRVGDYKQKEKANG
jgi:hypothetical protein